jgi:hypothetical protein
MPRRSELEAAFDAAISQTRKCIALGMTTSGGQDAGSLLEKLQQELERERQRALDAANIDRVWIQRTIRWLVEWVPESDLTLIAALGRIARTPVAGIT